MTMRLVGAAETETSKTPRQKRSHSLGKFFGPPSPIGTLSVSLQSVQFQVAASHARSRSLRIPRARGKRTITYEVRTEGQGVSPNADVGCVMGL